MIDSGPTGTIGESSVTFAFHGSDTNDTFQCSLDGAPWAPCTSPQQYTALAEGAHTFQVRAINTTGEVDATPAGASFAVDSTPPPVSLISPTDGSVTSSIPLTFSGAAGTAAGDLPAVTVQVYAGSAVSGTPAQTLTATASDGAWSIATTTPLSEGTYTAQASQADETGNTGTSNPTTFTIQSASVGSSSPELKTTPDTTMPSVEPSLTATPPGAMPAATNQTITPDATSGAVVNDPKCATNTLPANDDGSTGQVPLPFTLNFYGRSYSSLWVNNNGDVTFTGPLSTFTPFVFTATTPPIIAPFFADVDTRGPGSGLVTYGDTTYEGHTAFCVDWPNVGYYYAHTDKLNDFQLLLVNRGDLRAGDFEIVFNYDRIQWETGDASGGSDGFGGTSAGVGFANGDGSSTHFYSLPGTLQNGAFLDSNLQTGLIRGDHGTSVLGRYIFPISNGAPVTSNRYVALGDSVTYGQGLVFESANDGPSHRAYPEAVDRGLGLRPLKYRPYACVFLPPFSTYYDQLAVNGAPSIANPWTSDDNECDVSIHEAVYPQEVESAGLSTEPPALVTILAGADDINFSKCLESLLGIPGRQCVEQGSVGYHLNSTTAAELKSLYRGLSDTVEYIHRYAPSAQIVMLDYYQLVPPPLYSVSGGSEVCKGLRLATALGRREGDSVAADFLQQELNETIESVEARYPDIIPVDISNLFYGHELCVNDSWLINEGEGAGHPTVTGQSEIADAVLAVCDKQRKRCVGR